MVREWERRHREVFVPLIHHPSEAQVDFGSAVIVWDGQTTPVALFVMTLLYSDALFCCVFPRECTEAFLEGQEATPSLLGPGDMITLPACAPHVFRTFGDQTLRILGIHASPTRIVNVVSDQSATR